MICIAVFSVQCCLTVPILPTLVELHTADPNWYSSLTAHLNSDQQKEVQEVFTQADQRKAAEGV